MIQLALPPTPPLTLRHLVMDFNGTLACDGALISGVRYRLNALASTLDLHVLTGDIFGCAAAELSDVACQLHVLGPQNQAAAKRDYVERLGPEYTVCIGNGCNDSLMLRTAALGIAVMQAEGLAKAALEQADVLVPHVCPALDLLAHPKRLTATLRM